ncbi:MAG: leucine-rich repeat domain-containing protein [Candidatus Methanomethylophilaceae archaeon]|nr:leucine-rich repeat domain-containing protein [Candidatus Methanomethylophilaceae archaeon]
MDEEPKNWPYAGQYYSQQPGMVQFPKGANFYSDTVYINLNWFPMLTLNIDTIEVVGTLTADDLNELKRAVHFFPMDMFPWLQSFTIDDFKITVVNGDGEVVVFQDQIVRSILASDWYTVTVTGNVANGYTGTLFGSCFIDREAPEDEVTGFEYEDYTTVGIDGVKITKYTGSDKDVVIPDFIDGKKVLAIGDNAFKNNKDITSVTFGKYVRTVGFKAFAGCSALKSVEFNDDLQVIGAYAFYLDKALTKVVFGNGLRAVRENAFSIDFISGIATENLAGREFYTKSSRSEPSMPGFIPAYGNYVDDDNKSQYYAKDALAGRLFIVDENVKSFLGVPENANALVATTLDLFFGEDEPIKLDSAIFEPGFFELSEASKNYER